MIISAVKHCYIAVSVALFLVITGPASAVENQWTWIKGDDDPTTVGVYGELGVPADANTPRGMGFPAKWTDVEGNAWLYSGPGNYNTMWKFDHSTRNWEWMAGTSTPLYAQPVYGIKGEEAAGNTPGIRAKSTTWADESGNLWLYGGVDTSFFADLWKFNTQSLKWTWVHGSNQHNQPAVYGEKGIAAAENTPGSRFGSAGWVDDDGNFWLFGGRGFGGMLNDLWKYDVSAGEWTWVGGTQTQVAPPVYGTQGVASPDNIPGGRSDSATWRDSDGNFWLFGGFGNTIYTDDTTTSTVGRLNDVWKYKPAAGEWTWVSGSRLVHQRDIAGTRGVPDASNQPGGRHNIGAAVDNHNQAWIMGGTDNVLWCYNMDQNLWTWVHGNLSESPYGIYGTRGVAAPENTPGARNGHAMWTDPEGNIMLFGAYQGFGATGHVLGIHLNDLWTLTPGVFSIPNAAEAWELFQ